MSGQSENLEACESETNSKSGGAVPGVNSSSLTRRGTGPRTTLGKERSKHNALKHGIFSKVVVLKGESTADYSAMLSGLRDHFQPMGLFENSLVEILAVTMWRQRRSLVAETAEIEAGRAFLRWDEEQSQRVEAGKLEEIYHSGGLMRKIENAEILETSISYLKTLKNCFEEQAFECDENISVLLKLYGLDNENQWRTDLFSVYNTLLKKASLPNADVKECKNDFLSKIDQEIVKLTEYQKKRNSIVSKRRAVDSRRRSVPDSRRLDQLLRYDSSLDRKFERTLSQLERAQAIRRGQPVLAPIKVDISST